MPRALVLWGAIKKNEDVSTKNTIAQVPFTLGKSMMIGVEKESHFLGAACHMGNNAIACQSLFKFKYDKGSRIHRAPRYRFHKLSS
ncbi:hypothetical protein AVEN_173340-1 [Araneus ventricosus]|uniref:Uncharacterized protein n=1 Tax=Araneus ventricosus TaxID=182803 RepID=A0A4Y2IB35_ARAVE|nr:hypothetical protein AVEN_173340-1 [Araneus ventricosus]